MLLKRYRSSALLAPVILTLSACGEGAEEPVAQTEDGTVAMAEIALDSGPVPAGMAVTFALQPVGSGSAAGEATLSGSASSTEALVRLTNSSANGTHQGHIHSGTCANIGGVVAPLEPIDTDAQGTGTSTTTVDLPLATAADGQHLVAYHEAGGNPGPPVACGEIPALNP